MKFFLPLIIFLALIVFLWQGLALPSAETPTARIVDSEPIDISINKDLVIGAQDKYPFKTAQQQTLFNKILHELRCVVCQNQSLSESQASLAVDLRKVLHQQVISGRSEQEILTYITERYGDFALYRPPFLPATWILWFGPLLMLIMAGLILLGKDKKQGKRQVMTEGERK